jgi:hypothetical protein
MTGAPASIWTTKITQTKNGPEASILLSRNVGTPLPFRVKGMCYSPCPIGGSNAFGPAIGDWFWDSFATVTSWQQTWSNDLPMIKSLGVNVIRIYCMLANQLPPSQQLFTHKAFLDACEAQGLYVLVGIPLPQSLFCSNQDPTPAASWWESALTATVTQMATHPAVMGFIVANEVDNGNLNTYNPDGVKAGYWWSQVEKMAALAKKAAPTKLVGISNHDDPGICDNCQTYMAACPSVDFWGVNTYQTQQFDSVFGGTTNYPTGYATLTGTALKPVMLTEYGMPATSRPNALDPTGIYSDATTEGRAAAVISTMVPKAFAELMSVGLCYFEYCDEWWNQSAYSLAPDQTCPGATAPDAPNTGAGGNFVPPNTFTWYGGPVACGFPNYYWDNDGFGLYSIGVGQGRDPSHPWDVSTNAPALPLDTRTARTSMISALKAAWPAS